MRLYWIIIGVVLFGPIHACGEAAKLPAQELLRLRSGVFLSDASRLNAANLKQMLRANRDFETNTLKIESRKLDAPAWQILRILTDTVAFQAATGAPAASLSTPGSVFLKDDSLFGGAIRAHMIQLEARADGADLYQLWHGASPLPADHPTHAGEMSMPADYYTLVHFEIRPASANSARLTIYQHGVPAYSEEHFAFGWKNFYIASIERALAGDS